MGKANYNVQAWLDIRTIASIIATLDSRDISVRSFSGLIKDILEDYEASECTIPFTTVEESVEYLIGRGFSVRQLKDKHRPTLRNALRKESGELRENPNKDHRALEIAELLAEGLEDCGDSSTERGPTGDGG